MKILRDIVIVVFIIALAVMIRIWISSKQHTARDLSLGEDIVPTETKGMGAGASMLDENDQAVAAVVLGQEITTGEINRRANQMWAMASGGMPGIPEVAEMRDQLILQTFAEMLSEMLTYNLAGEMGFDVDSITDEALKEWASDYDSPAEKLKQLGGMGGAVTEDDIRKLLKKDAVYTMVEKTVTRDMQDLSDDERDAYFKSWFTAELISLQIDFKDEALKALWTDYVDKLNAHAVAASGEANTAAGET